MSLLNVKNLSVYIDKCPIVKDVEFELKESEVLFVLGQNGSGKSTLLQALVGTLNPRELTINDCETLLLGRSISAISLREKSHILTAVFQRPELSPELSVEQYFKFSNIEKSLDFDRIKVITKKLNIFQLVKRKLRTLSGGEFKKVAIAAALYQNTKIIFLDEPFQALDPIAKKEVAETISYFRKEEGKSFVIVSHDFFWSKALATQTLFLKEGEVLACGKTDVVFNQENLSNVFNVKFDAFRFNERSFLHPRIE